MTTWRLVGGGITALMAMFFLVGWLVTEGNERRTYGWVALAAGLATYWVVPWLQLQERWK